MRNYGYAGKGVFLPARALKDVEETISETFGVKLHRYSLGYLDIPEHKEIAQRVITKRGGEENRLEGEIKAENCFTIFTGDIEKDNDYMIFFPDYRFFTPNILTEEMTHGEHACLHASSGKDVSYDRYHDKFGTLSSEFVPSLAMYKVQGETERFTGPVPFPDEVDTKNLQLFTNWIAHGIAKNFMNTVADVPYRDLFHASDEVAMWDVVLKALGKGQGLCATIGGKYDEQGFKNSQQILADSRAKPVMVDIAGPSGKNVVMVYLEGRTVRMYEQ